MTKNLRVDARWLLCGLGILSGFALATAWIWGYRLLWWVLMYLNRLLQ